MKTASQKHGKISGQHRQQKIEKFDSAVYAKLLDDMREVYKYCQIDSIQQTVLQQKLGLLLQNIQMSNITRLPLIGCIYNAVSAKVNCIVNSIYNEYNMKNCDVPCNIFSFFYNPTNYEAERLHMKKDLPIEEDYGDAADSDSDANKGAADDDIAKPLTKQQEAKYIRNMGGFVHLDENGYHDYITGVDISSSYPAAKESNNIDKNSLITAEDFADILINPEDYGISEIKVIQLYDMYSPYIDEHLKIEYDDIDLAAAVDEVRYDLSYPKKYCKRTYRYLIECYTTLPSMRALSRKLLLKSLHDFRAAREKFESCPKGNPKGECYIQQNIGETEQKKKYTFGQYFYYKTNQDVRYPFVFLRQTPDYSIRPEAPKAQMLLDFRVRRQQAKRNLKAATDPFQRDFFNAQQQAIKILINSEYGANDSQFCTAYNMFESSLVTKQARYAIQNCRDTFTSPTLSVPLDKSGNSLLNTDLMKDYNDFLNKTCTNPELMRLTIHSGTPVNNKKDNITYVCMNGCKKVAAIKNIDVHLVYTDTDSSYVTLPQLNQLIVKPEYKDIEVYIRSTVQGKYNIFYQDYIKKIMHKRSLEFGFEGAFYKAWHITNKTYLGQKIDCITTSINPQGIIVPSCHIEEQIDFSDFNVESDTLVSKYLASKHIKITGLKIIKRNTIKLAVIYYLKAIAAVLNNRLVATASMMRTQQAVSVDENITDSIVESLLTELRDNFDSYKRLTLMEKKKVTVKFKATPQGEQFNLGESVYFYYRQPQNLGPNRFYMKSGQKKTDLIVYLTQRQPSPEQLQTLPEPFKAQYIFNIASNLYKFFDNELTETDIKEKLRQNGIIAIGAPKQGKVKELSQQQLIQYADILLQRNIMEADINQHIYSLTKIVGEINTRKGTNFTPTQKQRYAQLALQLEQKLCQQLEAKNLQNQ